MLDVLAARLYYYYSLSYERTDSLADIRGTLLALHQTATLRHDELGQETLLNLLLRNYLHYSLYDQAEKLRSKTLRSDSHSNQQMLRNVYCKLPARLHQVPEVFKSNVPSGQLLSVFSWGRFKNAQLSCNRACAKLSFPTLSSPML
jgi:hypothetical protein